MENPVQALRLERRPKVRTLETTEFNPHDEMQTLYPMPNIIHPSTQEPICPSVFTNTYPVIAHHFPHARDRGKKTV